MDIDLRDLREQVKKAEDKGKKPDETGKKVAQVQLIHVQNLSYDDHT